MTEERFIELLQNAVTKVKTEEDPVELNKFRKLFKKNVPFALRNYVAAYLAKSAEGGNRRENSRQRYGKEAHHESPRFQTKEPRTEQAAQPAPRVEIDEALASTLFISIGRNRHVFPRDLIGLITQNTGLERSRIGDIRVLDNYSFVQFYTEDCDSVIKALDGFSYRGRKLTVSYSKKRTDSADELDEKTQNDTIPETEASEASAAGNEPESGTFLV